MSNPLKSLVGYHPIVSCEGTAEQVIVSILLKEDYLVFPAEDIIAITRKRKAIDIQSSYLDFDYDYPVCVLRILDSRKERFKLGNLYSNRFPVADVITHPEIEILTIIYEGAWKHWHKTRMKPNDFCKQELGLKEIKSESFLKRYWYPEKIKTEALEYKRISYIPKGEVCLADLIK